MPKWAILALGLTLSGLAQAASVWKVTDGDNTLFLGGTLHILSPQDYPLPDAYQQAYSQADSLVFETDIAALDSAEFTQQSLALLTYQGKGSLADDISPATLKALDEYLAARGLDSKQFMDFKPALVGITLSMIEFKRMGLTSQGVDNYFYALGEKDGKNLAWFETPKQQLEFIANMGAGEEDAYLQYTMQDINDMSSEIETMKNDWLTGDMDALYDLAMDDLAKQYPKVYDELLTERNHAWLPKITQLMTTPEIEFVLVGTMHMAGEDGVLALLKAKGYIIEQLK